MIKINDIEIPFSGVIELTEINSAVLEESSWTFPFTMPFCDELAEAIGYIHLAESYNVIGKKYRMEIEVDFVHHFGECTCSNITTEGLEFSFIANEDFYSAAKKTLCTDLAAEIISMNKTDIQQTLTNPEEYGYIFAPCKVSNFGEKIGIDFDNIEGIDYSIVNESKDSPIVIPFIKLNKALSTIFANYGINISSNTLNLFDDLWLYNNFNIKWVYFGVHNQEDYAWLVSLSSGNEPTVTICYRGNYTFGSNSLIAIDIDGKFINAQISDFSHTTKKDSNYGRSFATFKLKNFTLDKEIICGTELQSVTLERGIDLGDYEKYSSKDELGNYAFTDDEYRDWVGTLKCYSSLLVTVTDTSKLVPGMTVQLNPSHSLVIDQIVDDKSFRVLREELPRTITISADGIKTRTKPWIDGASLKRDIGFEYIDFHGSTISFWIKEAVSESEWERCEYKIGFTISSHALFKQIKVYHIPLNSFFVGSTHDNPTFWFNTVKHLPLVTISDFLTAVKNMLGFAITVKNKTAYIETWNSILSQNAIDITDIAGEITEMQLDGYDSFKLNITGSKNELFSSVKELTSYNYDTEGENEPPFDAVGSLYLNKNNNALYESSPYLLSNLGNWKLASYNYIASKTDATTSSINTLTIESEAGVPMFFCTTLVRLKVLSGGDIGSSFELIVDGESHKFSYTLKSDIYKNEYENTRPGGWATPLVSNLPSSFKNSEKLLVDFEISEGIGSWQGWIILKNRNEYKKVTIGYCNNITLNLIEEKLDSILPWISQPGTFSIYEKWLRPETGVILCRSLGYRHDVFESAYFDTTPNGYKYNVPFTLEVGGENGTYEKLWKAYIEWQIKHKKTITSVIDFSKDLYLSGNWLRLFRIKNNAYIVKQIKMSLNCEQNTVIFADTELIKA